MGAGTTLLREKDHGDISAFSALSKGEVKSDGKFWSVRVADQLNWCRNGSLIPSRYHRTESAEGRSVLTFSDTRMFFFVRVVPIEFVPVRPFALYPCS